MLELRRVVLDQRAERTLGRHVLAHREVFAVGENFLPFLAEDEIDVELKENVLTVKGEQAKKDTEVEYLHKGISARNFVRTFPLAENVEVRGATVQNGILAIALEQIVPEEKKPKKIAISFAK